MSKGTGASPVFSPPLSIVSSPGFLAVINPVLPYLRIKREVAEFQIFFISAILQGSKEFGYGVSQCLTREYAVCNQTYTKMLGIFPGVNTKPTCLINNQPAFSAGTPWPSCLNTHLSAIIPSFQTLANLNT